VKQGRFSKMLGFQRMEAKLGNSFHLLRGRDATAMRHTFTMTVFSSSVDSVMEIEDCEMLGCLLMAELGCLYHAHVGVHAIVIRWLWQHYVSPEAKCHNQCQCSLVAMQWATFQCRTLGYQRMEVSHGMSL
jgi:hypothetical protein